MGQPRSEPNLVRLYYWVAHVVLLSGSCHERGRLATGEFTLSLAKGMAGPDFVLPRLFAVSWKFLNYLRIRPQLFEVSLGRTDIRMPQ